LQGLERATLHTARLFASACQPAAPAVRAGRPKIRS
jgi:hypothetical protein